MGMTHFKRGDTAGVLGKHSTIVIGSLSMTSFLKSASISSFKWQSMRQISSEWYQGTVWNSRGPRTICLVGALLWNTIQGCCWEQPQQIHRHYTALCVAEALNSSAQQALKGLRLKSKARTKLLLVKVTLWVGETCDIVAWDKEGERQRETTWKETKRELWARGVCDGHSCVHLAKKLQLNKHRIRAELRMHVGRSRELWTDHPRMERMRGVWPRE